MSDTRRRPAAYKEAAAYLGVPEGTLRCLVSRRQVPHTRMSARLVRFDLDQLDAWLAERSVQPTKAATP